MSGHDYIIGLVIVWCVTIVGYLAWVLGWLLWMRRHWVEDDDE